MPEESTQEPGQKPEQATMTRTTGGNVSAQTVQIHQAVADLVHAEQDVTIRQGGAKEIRAQEVSIRQGVAGSIDADHVQITQGAAGLVRSNDVTLGPGSTSAAIIADTVKLDQAGAQFVLARDSVEIDQGAVGVLVGQHITTKDSTALLMFADKVEGDVQVVMDRQMAITFGAAMGAALGIVLAVFGVLRKRGRD